MDTPDEIKIIAEEASAEAAHKAKGAQQAIEIAREAQLAQAVARTKDALLEGLKEVFGSGDSGNPREMRVLVHRIPILCTRIDAMDKNIQEMRDNQKWAVRIIVALFLAAVGKVVFMG